MKIYDYSITDRNGNKKDLKEQIKEDKIDGIKNKMAKKAVEKISKTKKKEEDIKWILLSF